MGRERAYLVGKFKDAEAMDRYKKNFNLRLFSSQREFPLSDFEDVGIPSLLKSRGWLSVVGPVEPQNIQIIREFYANIPPLPADQPFPDSFDVYLRGKTLNFSVNSIAQLCKLPRLKPDEPGFDYDQLVAKLDMILVRSTLVGPYRRLPGTFPVKRLTYFYYILNCIVDANIDPRFYPSCHSGVVTPDRARLLYAIGTNLPIDLAAYIFRVICRYATFTHGELPFGSLITRFAMDSQVRIDPTDRIRSSLPPMELNNIPYVKRRVPSSPAFNPARAHEPAPVPPINNMMLHGKISVPSSPTVNPAPASEPTPQLNQPPIVRHDRAQLINGVAELRGDSPAINVHPESPSPTNLQQSTASTCDSHPKKKAKKDPMADAIGEMAKLVKEFLASQMKPQLRGEEVLGVVSKVPNLSRLQVLKAVRILLNGNPEEFSLLKSLPDATKTEWILLIISQSEV